MKRHWKRKKKKEKKEESLGVVLQPAWGVRTTLMALNWGWFSHPKDQILRWFIFIFIFVILAL
jgi:hypothetical protein